jgi:hypothetical protein
MIDFLVCEVTFITIPETTCLACFRSGSGVSGAFAALTLKA